MSSAANFDRLLLLCNREFERAEQAESPVLRAKVRHMAREYRDLALQSFDRGERQILTPRFGIPGTPSKTRSFGAVRGTPIPRVM
jgi:hypothetical protein